MSSVISTLPTRSTLRLESQLPAKVHAAAREWLVEFLAYNWLGRHRSEEHGAHLLIKILILLMNIMARSI